MKPNGLAHSVAVELAKVGYQPHPLRMKLVNARIADRGQLEYESLRRYTPSLSSFGSLCSPSMGIGASLAEFLISGLQLDQKLKSEIATLGGLVNTIVALFDTLLDDSQSAPALFSGNPQFSADAEICARQKLVVELVALYFHKLTCLPGAGTPVRSTIDRAIRRLYEAELKTASSDKLSWSTWWRKNALHTVTIGLPAWFGVEHSGELEYSRHLMWLGRVGEFFGWLDDAADYEADRASGSANWFFQHPAISGETSTDNAARHVAAKGHRILKDWDSRNADSPMRDTFVVLAWKWVTAPAGESHHASDS